MREPDVKTPRGPRRDGPQGGGIVSLRRTRVSESTHVPSAEDSVDSFKLTLLETPSLPASLPRQFSCWWQEQRAQHPSNVEAPLPVADMRLWFRNLPEQILGMLCADKS